MLANVASVCSFQNLDNETFSVNNGAHFPLEKMPHIPWISALEGGITYNIIVLPGLVSDEETIDLVAPMEDHAPNDSLTSLGERRTAVEVSRPSWSSVSNLKCRRLGFILKGGKEV